VDSLVEFAPALKKDSMNNTIRNGFLILATVFAVSVTIGGCASKTINESNPKDMYEDADQDIKNDRYLIALDKLRIVKTKFSYSSYGALAQLRIGDVYFLQESYTEAASAYETFGELYPKNEKAPYALFRAGESYYMDIPSTIERDMKSADSAISTFNSYLKKYPAGENVEKAKDLKHKAYNKLAEKELDIAQFYLRRKKVDAAKGRLQKILDQYPDSDVAPKAKELIQHLPFE
jgi:outer membrane protein assembly factor BamD